MRPITFFSVVGHEYVVSKLLGEDGAVTHTSYVCVIPGKRIVKNPGKGIPQENTGEASQSGDHYLDGSGPCGCA